MRTRMDGGKPGIGVFGSQGDEVRDLGYEVLLVSLGNWLDGLDGSFLLFAPGGQSLVDRGGGSEAIGSEVALAMAFRTPLPLYGGNTVPASPMRASRPRAYAGTCAEWMAWIEVRAVRSTRSRKYKGISF